MKLSELVEVKKGKKPVSATEMEKAGTAPVLFTSQLRGAKPDTYSEAFTGQVLATPDDVIISWDGSIGVSAHGLSGVVGSTLARLRPHDQGQIHGAYLAEFLSANEEQIRIHGKGATIPHIDGKYLGSLDVPLLPIADQIKCADTLGSIRKLVRASTKQEMLLTELERASTEQFLSSAAWPTAPLSDLTSKIGSGSTPKGGKGAYATSGVALVRSMNIHDGRFVWKELARLTTEQADSLRNVTVMFGDVFLNITGASVARCCMAPEDLGEARVNQHVMILRPDTTKINPIFLERVLISTQVKESLLRIAGGGATREAITKSQLEGFVIPCPPLSDQNLFVKKMAMLGDLVPLARSQTLQAAELFQSIQFEFFRAE
jgi:type I restriction enzyme S subunit